MNRIVYLVPTVATLGLLAGGLVGFFTDKPAEESIVQAVENEKHELKTDAFSLHLFQHTLSEQSGNILVAPHTLTHILLELQAAAAGKTLEDLEKLQLAKQSVARATEPLAAALLAMDFNLPVNNDAGFIKRLPFSENVPLALSFFNGLLAPATGNPDAQFADSQMVTGRTKLLAGCASLCQKEWEIPFHAADTCTADFDSANGSMPRFQQMRSRALHRSAKAEDGSWQAVVLPFKAESEVKAPQLVFIGILPAGDAREFARTLTPELLTGIRRKLAEAQPEDTLVELPRLEQIIRPYDMRDSLRRMGLKSLFDTETADFSALTPEKIHLGALIQSMNVRLVESDTKAKADDSLNYAAKVISFNRPFIWMIADLETGTPIDYIGLIEEM